MNDVCNNNLLMGHYSALFYEDTLIVWISYTIGVLITMFHVAFTNATKTQYAIRKEKN
jgi:hypothetical protein